jgi:hypothetical protein
VQFGTVARHHLSALAVAVPADPAKITEAPVGA